MNREEILKQAQQENNGKDIADLEAQKKGAYSAYMVGVCLVLLVDIVEAIILHRINFGGTFAVFAMLTVAFFTKYRALGKKHELFVTLAYGFGTVVCAALWVMQLCGVIG